MSADLLLALVVLALIDSTSFGTLLIPLWLMLAPGRPRPGRIVLFLLVVAGFYLVLGILLTAGALTLLDELQATMRATPFRVAQLVLGVVLLTLGLTIEPLTRRGKERRAARRRRKGAGDRMHAWRARVVDGGGGSGALVGLAVTAAAVEAASMVPYLAAIGLIVSSGPAPATALAVLTGYCAVMITPALLLLVARLALHERVTPLLGRVESWLSANAREATAWVVFLLGLFVAGDALGALRSG